MKINLHIDRVVLDGINIKPGEQQWVQAGLEAELSRLLVNRGLAPDLLQNISLSHLNTNGVQLAGNSNPVQLGQQIAQSVYGCISHE